MPASGCLAWAALTLGLLPLTGCQTRGPRFDARAPASLISVTNLTEVHAGRPLDPQWLQPRPGFFTLGPGDQLEIEVLGDPASRATVLVGPDGKIYYHLLPGLKVAGLNLAATKALLERELERFLRQQPRVALSLRTVSSQRIWLLGRLNAPGVYPLTGPTTLLEGVALARGPATPGALAAQTLGPVGAGLAGTPDEVADLRRSFVMRQGQLLPVDFDRLLRQGDLAQNIYLEPDDFVYLPSLAAQEVYVLGAVAQPRPVSTRDRPTLISVIAGAGGTIKDAYLSHVAIVRGSLTSPHIAVVDYQDIVRGRAPDVELHPQDIVYVPFAPYRTLTRYADMILTTFVRTVGINEGARAVSRGVVPVGVNVQVGP